MWDIDIALKTCKKLFILIYQFYNHEQAKLFGRNQIVPSKKVTLNQITFKFSQ